MTGWPFEIPLRPMEPLSRREPFDDPDFGFQVKWDGVRSLAYVAKPDVCLFNRKLHPRTRQYPELQILKEIPADYFTLDGEIIALADARPCFPAVMRRDRAINTEQVEFLKHTVPVNYMVFDLLCLNGNSLLAVPMEERYGLLQQLLAGLAVVYPVDTFWGKGLALFEACKKNNLEGIVAKQRRSRYLPGIKSPLWQKIKNYQQQLCMVGGMVLRGNTVSSLYLGLWEKDHLRYVGRASSGLSTEIGRELAITAQKLKTSSCPFTPRPRIYDRDICWVKPDLLVLIEFLEWTEDLKLRHPRIIDFPAAVPSEATLSLK